MDTKEELRKFIIATTSDNVDHDQANQHLSNALKAKFDERYQEAMDEITWED